MVDPSHLLVAIETHCYMIIGQAVAKATIVYISENDCQTTQFRDSES